MLRLPRRPAVLSHLALLLALAPLAASLPVERVESGALVMENIPPADPAVAERLGHYNQPSRSFSDWDYSGTGLYVVVRSGETRNLHHVATPGARRVPLTSLSEPVRGVAARPAAGPREVLLTVDEGGAENFQILRLTADGNIERLTDGTSRHSTPVWSRDGASFAYTSTARNGRDADIMVASATAPAAGRLVKEGWPGLQVATFTADGSGLLLTYRRSVADRSFILLDLISGEERNLLGGDANDPVTLSDPHFSPDGKALYFLSDADAEFTHLRRLDLASGSVTDLTPELNWGIESLSVSNDGRWAVYSVNADGLSELHVKDLTRGTSRTVAGLPVGVIGSTTFAADQRQVAFSVNAATSPSDVYAVNVETLEVTAWTTRRPGRVDPSQLVTPRIVRFPTFDSVAGQPREISAILYEPAGPGPHPVVVVIHGGPEGQSRPTYSSAYQFWANELGLAVALPNVRGSTGYGRSFVNLDNGFQREDSVRDIGALLDWIGTQPQLDGGRVAVYGGSYGGYMVYASLMHYGDRLAGGVANVGISHWVTFLESTADYRRDLRRVEYGDERDPAMRAHLHAISPLTNVHRLRKPMIIGQGANDPRVPRSEAEQIVAAMRAQGVPVSYFLALNEGHGFAKKSNSDAWRLATTDFLVRLLAEPREVLATP